MFCGKCGKEYEEGTLFCPGCGTRIDDDVSVTGNESITGEEKAETNAKEKITVVAIIGGVAVVLLCVLTLAVVLISKAVKGSGDIDEMVDASGTDVGGTAADQNDAAVPAVVTVSITGANETGAIVDAMVYIKGEGSEMSGTTDDAGCVSFVGLKAGEYTIECEADGYNRQDVRINLKDGDLMPVVAMVPEIQGGDAMVLLTWQGDHDLDLCAFNTEMKEYINIGHPMDSEGNVFLYADHGADEPYEVIYIHNANEEVARTFYVIEAANARNGESSTMEVDGVRIQVYDESGLVYDCEPDDDEDAALWCPCYYYAGTVYDQGDYIYDATGDEYAWISFDVKDAAADASQDDGWKRAYLNLLYQYGSEGEYADDGIGTTASIFYLDDDDIPEISIVTGGAGPYTWGAIYSYSEGEPIQLCTANASVIPGEGMIYEYNPYDSMGSGDNRILKWDGISVQELWYGSEYVNEEASTDSEVLLREYTSNGRSVSQEEYNADIAKYYDFNRCVGTGTDMTFAEAVAYLSEALWGYEGGTEWKQAYLKVVNDFIGENGYDNSLCWGLLFIDDDNIPELIWDTGTTAGGEMVYTYNGGEAVEIYYAYSGISFILGEGLISGYTGHGVNYVDVVKLSDGKATAVWEGVEDFYEAYMGNPDAEPVYYSNDVEVTEGEYSKAYADAFDGKKAVLLVNPSDYMHSWNDEYHSRCIPGMTTEELIAYLTTISAPSDLDANISQSYLDVIKGNTDSSWIYSYNLIYLDNDDIPELVVFYDDPEGGGAQFDTDRFDIYRYQGGKSAKVKSVSPYETDGYGDFYLRNKTLYYEKKDYISAAPGWEYVADSSSGCVYFPVIDVTKPVFAYLDRNYWDDNSGSEVKYEAWYRDNAEISESDYKKSAESLPQGKDIRDESMSREQMIGLLQSME